MTKENSIAPVFLVYLSVVGVFYALFGRILPEEIASSVVFHLVAWLAPLYIFALLGKREGSAVRNVEHGTAFTKCAQEEIAEAQVEVQTDDSEKTEDSEQCARLMESEQVADPAEHEVPKFELRDREFAIRLHRAQTETMEIIDYMNRGRTKAYIANLSSGHTYEVSRECCGCEDFRKRQMPCKHMIYLALQNGTIEELKTRWAMLAGTGTDVNRLVRPGTLVAFEKIANAGHEDPRALVYTIRGLDGERKRPFSADDLDAVDFENGKRALKYLLDKGIARTLDPTEELDTLHTKEELARMLSERGLPASGRKSTLAKRLVDSGYRIDRRKYRKRFFRITEYGKDLLERYDKDKQRAIENAINALKETNYSAAVAAYRAFDEVWGFLHIAGKEHTIFADYDIPYSGFSFFEQYAMRELENSEDFKKTLRACLVAGLMRGVQDGGSLRVDIERVCAEQIKCPRLLGLFDYDRTVLAVMREQIDYDPGSALEYYISHVMYLYRRSR